MKFKINFIGIGAARSGSTWLVESLKEHPQIFIPPVKEVGFFNKLSYNKNYSKGINWYQSFFKSAPDDAIIGEFTTHYMIDSDVPKLIKINFPDVKILVCLRNPADMLYSLYWWSKANFAVDEVPETFNETLKKDPEYKLRGQYYKLLKPYYDLFKRKQIKVILFDDIVKKPKVVLKDLFRFLGVDEKFKPSTLERKVNPGKQIRSKFFALMVYKIVKISRKFGFNIFLRTIARPESKTGKFYRFITQKSYNYPKLERKSYNLAVKMFSSDTKKLERLIGRDLKSWRTLK